MQYRIVEKESFQAAGIKREFSLVDEENLAGIPKLWGELNADGTVNRLAPLNNGEIEGILGVCVAHGNAKSIDYWVATATKKEVPNEFEMLKIPASKWAVFEVHGAMPHAMPKVWKQIFTEWFPSSGYELAGTPELEVYPDGNPFSSDYYSEIWIPVK